MWFFYKGVLLSMVGGVIFNFGKRFLKGCYMSYYFYLKFFEFIKGNSLSWNKYFGLVGSKYYYERKVRNRNDLFWYF